MKQYVLDTNVLVRFFVGDNLKQKQQAILWFKEAQNGAREITVIPLVVAETCFVLESFYKQPRSKIADALEVFLSQRWLKVQNRNILLGSLYEYRKGDHFVDSFLSAWAENNVGSVLTFDKKLGKKI